MCTPQKTTWSLKPRVSSETPISKGKGIAGNHDSAAAPPPPPLESLNGRELNLGGEDMEAWKRFKEEGLLEESLSHRKGRVDLASTILELKKELHYYQYTMDLLLIEKKEWSSNMEELKARLAEAEENSKREKAAHMIALTESERREDNLCKALGLEMQCVSDLEKTLREMQSENAEIKLAYETKMAEGHALEASISERDERMNAAERALKKVEDELKEAKRSTEGTNTLKSKEEEIELKMKNLQKKEKELLEVEEKLNHPDEHNATLDTKTKKELESKRKSIEEELIIKFDVVNRVEKEVNHKQELINKRERELQSKMNEIKIKEKGLEAESEALKKWEESLKSEEKKLIVEKDQITKDKHELKVSINELQSLRDALKAEEHQIAKDREKLEISKEERKQYIQKQSELKQEIEKYANMKEGLSKEIDSLREEREKLEKERESLNDEILMLQGETKKIQDEKEKLEKWHHKEQERLRNADTNAQKEAFENTMKHERQYQSISIGGGRRKKHKTSTAPGEQTPTEEKRYNLRHSTFAKNSGATSQAVSDPSSFTK